MAQAAPILRHYETVVLVRPEVTEQGQETIRQRVRDIVAAGNGVEVRWETWGKRKLAYEIDKQNKAIYLYANFVASQASVLEIERNLRIMENVMKYQTIRLSEALDLNTFDVEGERKKRTALYLTPEEAAAAERNWQREHDWALGHREEGEEFEGDEDEGAARGGVDEEEER